MERFSVCCDRSVVVFLLENEVLVEEVLPECALFPGRFGRHVFLGDEDGALEVQGLGRVRHVARGGVCVGQAVKKR